MLNVIKKVSRLSSIARIASRFFIVVEIVALRVESV